MSHQQLALFSAAGYRRDDAASTRVERPRLTPVALDDEALVDAIAAASLADCHDLFRKVTQWNTVSRNRLSTDAVRQILLRRAACAGLRGTALEPITPHGLRAGFVTTAYRNGVPDEEIMGHTRHRDLRTMRSYVRRAKLGKASPAGKLGL